MTANKRVLVLLGCGLGLAALVAGALVVVLRDPKLIVSTIVVLLVIFAFRGGGTSRPSQRPPGSPDQARRAVRRLTSETADSVFKAYEAGEISVEQRDELLKHIYHTPEGPRPGAGPGRPM